MNVKLIEVKQCDTYIIKAQAGQAQNLSCEQEPSGVDTMKDNLCTSKTSAVLFRSRVPSLAFWIKLTNFLVNNPANIIV